MSQATTGSAEHGVQYSINQYEHLAKLGAFDGMYRTRVELLFGEIRTMSPIGADHIAAVNWLNEWSYTSGVIEKVRVSVQNPIRLEGTQSEPEPDLVWSKRSAGRSHPSASDIVLLIEVASSSLEYDRTAKRSLYAKSGIADYWIVNLIDKQVEVYRDPAEGDYQAKTVHAIGQAGPNPLAATGVTLDVAELFAEE